MLKILLANSVLDFIQVLLLQILLKLSQEHKNKKLIHGQVMEVEYIKLDKL